jgi:predicted GNAT family acetyltransferase
VQGVPHIASVATHPDYRGQGLARATVGVMTTQLLDEGVPRVTLGSYAYNAPAAAVYRSLGYEVRHRWRSGRLTGRDSYDPSSGCAEP